MPEFEVITSFYTLVPWLTGGFILFGIVSAIGLAMLLGWIVGSKKLRKKTANLMLSFGWLPIFGLFVISVAAGSIIYYQGKDNLSTQINIKTGMEVGTFVRGDEYKFYGRDTEGKLIVCQIHHESLGKNRYKVNCTH